MHPFSFYLSFPKSRSMICPICILRTVPHHRNTLLHGYAPLQNLVLPLRGFWVRKGRLLNIFGTSATQTCTPSVLQYTDERKREFVCAWDSGLCCIGELGRNGIGWCAKWQSTLCPGGCRPCGS